MAEEQARDRRDGEDGGRGRGRSALRAGDALRSARAHLHELTGKDAEGVIRIEPADDGGWRVALEVLELARVPDTNDLLATYEMELDEDGELVGCRRVRRYARAEVGEDLQP
jgi:hypothetical protein